MKSFYYSTMAIAMICSAFVACQKEQTSVETENPVVEAKPFTVTVDNPFSAANDPQSKATFADGEGMKWEEGDQDLFRMIVGTTATDGEVVYAKSMTIGENGAATFTFDKTPAADKTVSFLYGNKGYGDLSFIFKGEQTQSALGNLDKNRLCLKAVNVKADGTSAAPKMQLVGNVRRFLIYSSTGIYSDEKVASIKMTPSSSRTLAGQISYNYIGQPVKSVDNNNNPKYEDVAETETVIRYNRSSVQVKVDNASLSAVTATKKAATKGKGICMAVPPQEETDRVRYVITTDKAEYILESDKLSFENGKVTNLFVDLESKFVARKEAGSALKEANYNGWFPIQNTTINADGVTGYTLGWCSVKIDNVKVNANNNFYGADVASFEYKDEEGKPVDWITCYHEVKEGVATSTVMYDSKDNTTGVARTAIVTAIYKPKGYLAIPAAVSVKVTQPAKLTTAQQ